MKSAIFSALFVFIMLFFWMNAVTKRMGEITAIQQAQMMGYHQIMVVDKVTFGAWFRRNCTFPQTTYIELQGTLNLTDIISVCINEWTGNTTIHYKHK